MKYGSKPILVERRGKIELYTYGGPLYPAWAVFVFPSKPGDPKIINGKWSDVWAKYQELIK